jgi:xanthine dehydrogenase accessory factor
MHGSFYSQCQQLIDEGAAFVSVTLVHREGSVPQDVGSKMIVTSLGLYHGTIGGGRVEARAIEHAVAMLETGRSAELVQWNLNTDIGMTCGGRLQLFFETTNAKSWSIAVFGAGHVAQALTRLLETLPCRVTCIDSRAEWLDRLPESTTRVLATSAEEFIDALSEETFLISVTQGHSHDLPILKHIWQTKRRFPFIGVIGSHSKAGVLRRQLREAGMQDGEIEFYCPVGLPIGSNHPGEIAVSIASQLIQVRDQRMQVEPLSRES